MSESEVMATGLVGKRVLVTRARSEQLHFGGCACLNRKLWLRD